MRGNQHDRQQLSVLHERVSLDREELVARFVALLDDAVGDTREARWAFVHLVEELWGEIAALEMRRRFGISRD